MNLSMRLFRRPPKTKPLPPESEWTWYAELDRKTRISLKTSKELLGHKDIKATQIYTHLSAEHLRAAAGKVRIGEE